jgi:nucleoside-diphosphate-sugar epimerase
MDQKNILITGATGFVGSHLVESSLEEGMHVSVISRSSSSLKNLPVQQIANHSIGLDNRIKLLEIMKGKDYLIHNAGVVNAVKPETYYKVNVDYTKQILLAAREAGVKKIIVTSSLAAVGPSNYGFHPTEIYIGKTVEPYGHSKRIMEELIQNEFSDLNIVITRPAGVYGPRDSDFLPMFRLFKKGLSIQLGLGPKELSLIYVKDLAKIYMKLLSSNITQGIFNIANPVPHQWMDLTKATEEVLGRNIKTITIPGAPVRFLGLVYSGLEKLSNRSLYLNYHRAKRSTANSYTCDSSKIFTQINSIQPRTLQQGFAETMKWYANNNWKV